MSSLKEKKEELALVLESNGILRKQVQLFESILERQSSAVSMLEQDQAKARKQRRAKDLMKTPTELTLEQKFEISTREIDHLQVNVDSLKTEGEQILQELRINLDDAEITFNLKTQIKKLEQQLNQKGEMGGMLSAIDFDQLKIENQQYLERIEERNNELLRLKLTTGKTVQALNTLKRKLDTLVKQNHRLQNEIGERKNQLGEFDIEIRRVEKEKNSAFGQYKYLEDEQEDVELPEVMDYIRIKADISELEKKVTDWERKIEIAGMKNKSKKSLKSKELLAA